MRSCLSPLQAGRKHFDEKLWNGKNETKFDKQHVNVRCSCSQEAINTSLMNSPPLSLSILRMGKGKSVRARWRAARTASWLRCKRGRHSVHPVATSVSVKVYR